MRTSRIKRKLSKNEPVLVTALNFDDPALYELTSLMGFDGIWLDMEHSSRSLETAAQLMRASRVGASDIVARPAKGEFMRMSRMLEAGAQGIMYPRCDGPEEAAQVVRWCKFSCLGERGVAGGGPDCPYLSLPLAEYIQEANRQTFIVIQLEQSEALGRAEEIGAVDGVDVLMLGPGDFSVLSGIPGQMKHPLIRRAKEQLARAARASGKHWGAACSSPDDLVELLEMGAKFICYRNDILMIKEGLEQIQNECSPLGFTFDNLLRN